MSLEHQTFPLEIWDQIMQYSSTSTLACLSQVSQSFFEEARRHMYHTIIYGDGSFGAGPSPNAKSGTRIKDIGLFEDIHSNSARCQGQLNRFTRQAFVQYPDATSTEEKKAGITVNEDGIPNLHALALLVERLSRRRMQHFNKIDRFFVEGVQNLKTYHLSLLSGAEIMPRPCHPQPHLTDTALARRLVP